MEADHPAITIIRDAVPITVMTSLLPAVSIQEDIPAEVSALIERVAKADHPADPVTREEVPIKLQTMVIPLISPVLEDIPPAKV